jgi:hypothetical protein
MIRVHFRVEAGGFGQSNYMKVCLQMGKVAKYSVTKLPVPRAGLWNCISHLQQVYKYTVFGTCVQEQLHIPALFLSRNFNFNSITRALFLISVDLRNYT